MKVARIVTASEAVEFHLRNTLDQFQGEYDLEVIGDNVSQYRERWPLVKFTDLKIVRKIHLWRDSVALIGLTAIFIHRRYDIVHSIMPKAGLISALAGFVTFTPVRMHTFTGQIWKNNKGPKRWIFKMIDRVIVALSTKCMTDSRSQSQFLFDEGIGQSNAPLEHFGQGSLSGVNLDRFNAQRLMSERKRIRNEVRADEDTRVFIFLGRKCKDKGTLDLLLAFRQAFGTSEKARLVLVGPEDDEDFKKLFYSEFEGQKNVFNYMSTTTPESFLAAGDVFCLPSYREGFGSVVIEAAALSLPTIGSDITGLKDAIVENETGLLIEPGDVQNLASCLKRALENPSLFKQMGEKAQERAAEKFAMKRLYELLSREYESLLNKKIFNPDQKLSQK
ncbi:MAG: glycosyltransferase family 4 protein [Bdellovibrionales bacterium]|nr:glycosyltransferase family 4 protein [Bdellovibrionales bacterium]